MQLCILGFGLFQEGDVAVGVFPEGEEVLVGSAGFGGVALNSEGAGKAEMRRCTNDFVEHNSAMIEDFDEQSSARG
jgi:hypothetical protein